MKHFRLNKVAYTLPNSLADCTTDQFGHIFSTQMALLLIKSPVDSISIKIGLLSLLSGIPTKILDKLTQLQLARLLQEIAWCYKVKVEKKPFNLFECEGLKYYLPKPNFGNTSAIELATCNIYYMAFTRKNNPNFDALWNIVATLCRPVRKDVAKFRNSKDWNGDEREEYNTTLADERAEIFKKKLNMGLAIAILQYFELMNNVFWKKHEDLLGESSEIQMYLNGEGQITMLMEIAELGSFGDFENVCKQPVHTIWMFLKDKKLKADKAERELQLQEEDD